MSNHSRRYPYPTWLRRKKFRCPGKLRFGLLLCLLSNTLTYAQVDDDFTDGNFTAAPAWVGDTDQFIVNTDGELQLAADAAGVRYLSTPSALVDSTEWFCYVRLGFNPSNNNFVRFYLVSDNADLTGPLQGYYLRIGENLAEDGLDLYRQDSTERTLLLETFPGEAATAPEVRVRVRRSAAGTWSLAADWTGGNAFAEGGTVADGTYGTSAHVGVQCQYTSSNADAFFFDDVLVRPIAIDETPPTAVAAAALNDSTVEVTFSEPVTAASATDPTHYAVDGGVGAPTAVAFEAVDPTRAVLTFASSFGAEQPYLLTVSALVDLADNEQAAPVALPFVYSPPFVPAFRQVVINEIMADPSPSVGLPEAEYVELLNLADDTVLLADFTLADLAGTVSLPPYALPPGGYVTLCDPDALDALSDFGPALAVSLPSLNNSAETLTLRRADGALLDSVAYTTAWYADADKDGGGWSLAQVNPFDPCSGQSNWRASTALAGGTPGAINAVFDPTPDTVAPALVRAALVAPDTLRLTFDEPLASGPTALTLGDELVATNTFLDDDELTLPLNGPVTPGVLYVVTVAGVRDCADNVSALDTAAFGLGRSPALYEVVIHEIMADPSPPVGLPEVEYVELRNTTDQLLELESCLFDDGGSEATFPNTLLRPGELIAVGNASAATALTPFGRTVALPGFPTLNNGGETLTVRAPDGQVVHAVPYTSAWYADEEKAEGGWSLEMVDAENPCGGADNWRASTAPTGGTPGAANSVVAANSDVTPPRLLAAERISDDTLRLRFDGPVDSLSLLGATYEVAGALTVTAVQPEGPTFRTALALLSDTLVPGQVYRLTVGGVRDCAGNVLNGGQVSFGRGAVPTRFSLLIHEIMADPTPPVGLPEVEYVELHNPTDQLFELTGCTLADERGRATLPGALVPPGGYLVLCAPAGVDALPREIPTLAVPNFPALANAGERLTLRAPGGALLHSVSYRENWYNDPIKAEGGWALEMIDATNACQGMDNWTASVASAGGTPGAANAAAALNPDQAAPRVQRTDVVNSTALRLLFDEDLDSAATLTATFALTPEVEVASVRVVFDTVALTLSNPLQTGVTYTLTVADVADCAGNASLPDTIALGLPEPAASGDLALNEVLFHPPVGGVDFVELFNASAKYLDLRGWLLADGRDGTVTDLKLVSANPYVLPPGAYVALTTDAARLRADYPQTVATAVREMPDLPVYPAAAGSVVLLTPDSNEYQRFDYDADFHYALIDDPRGVSLERIGLERPVNDPNSWQSAASDADYATPGFRNSQRREGNLPSGQLSLSPRAFTPDEDGFQDFTEISYRFDQTGYTANLTIYNAQGRTVRRLVRNALLGQRGFFKWDGTRDDGRKAPVGYYLIQMRLFDLSGNETVLEEKVVVGAKF